VRKFRPSELHADARGKFCAITRENWAEVNYIETRAGQVRGNHYHRNTRELFFIISGEIEVTITHQQSGERQVLELEKGDLLLVEPLEIHVFRTKTDAEWLNMLSEALDPHQPDFFRPGEDS